MILQYAGNVIVYGAISPCDGDWFGGITEDNAAAFFKALVGSPVRILQFMALSMCTHSITSPSFAGS